MDASLLSDKQLSALELMMQHADDVHINSQGAPRRQRKRKSVSEMFPDGFTYEEEYVGTGSRAKNREMRAQQANKPDNRAVVKALEVAFAEQSDDSEQIIKSVKEGTESSKDIAKALGDWLKWSQQRAFLEDHKAKADSAISPPSTDRGQNGNTLPAQQDDADFPPDIERDRNGNKRKRNGRRRPRSRLRARARMFGRSRAGKLLGLAAMAATGLGIGAWMKHDSSEDLEGADPHDENVTPASPNQPTGNVNAPVPANANTLPAETPRATAKTPEQIEAQDKADTMWDAGTSAAWLLGGAKRIPFIGTALTVADGAREAKKINDDDTLTDAEKKKEQTKNVTQTVGGTIGATAGAWLGGIAGSIVPLAGNAIGATLGGMLGGYLGDKIGGFVAEKLSNETDEAIEEDRKRREKQDREDSLKDEGKPSPFFLPFNLFGGNNSTNPNSGGFNNGAGPVRFPGATSVRAADIAKQVLASDKIGGVSEQFESGGRGVGTVSSGVGDFGGVSYGKHQLASNNGSMTQFLNSPEAKNLAGDFGGLTPGTPMFNERYKQIAGTRGKEMEDAQYQYLVRTHYAPTAERLEKNLGIDANKQGRAFKEMVYSTSMQYGGNAASKIERALKGKDLSKMSEQDIVEAVQKDKLANVQNDFRSSSAAVQQGVAARTMNELEVLKKLDATKQETEVAKTDSPTQELPTGIVKPEAGEAMSKATRTDEGGVEVSKVDTTPVSKEAGQVETKEQVEARLSKPGDAARTETQRKASKEDLEAARAAVHKELTGKDISPTPADPEVAKKSEVPFDQMSVPEKEAAIAKLRTRVDFMKRKNAYLKEHPELVEADDKKVNEVIREQQRQANTVVATEASGDSVVRSESLGTKEQPVVDVPRAKPLEPMPEPVAPSEPVQTASAPSGGGARSVPTGSASGNNGGGTGGKSASLDDIPIIIEDPMLNMINLGYV